MLGSPGRLIDLDQEYSAGASARTAAGGTPQVPLAPRLASPRLASDARPPSRSPQAEGPPRPALLTPRSRPGPPATHPPPPGGGPPAPQGILEHRSPLRACRFRGAARAEEPSLLAGGFLEWGGGSCSLFLTKALFKKSCLFLGSVPESFQLSSLKSFLDGINFSFFPPTFPPPPFFFCFSSLISEGNSRRVFFLGLRCLL